MMLRTLEQAKQGTEPPISASIRRNWMEAYIFSRIEILMAVISRIAVVSPLIDAHASSTIHHRSPW
ncbi:hypothetical protein BDV38DRAFT_254408 [Aspergillus pseudotamarii]|uniref:Uncharacterized protein n=1 Tax=Aspergillus pseudotamarii TaxID=132259 RepID=A0A5N6SNB9_ASPPS|nr:uncharacterized protein BDV38DRAFT_254408 [Aspergillus pseudotamarii]KAE8134654.1 hypothetical protein BDV38DRAFT_254408 [Aspergillus pseudotamarii]